MTSATELLIKALAERNVIVSESVIQSVLFDNGLKLSYGPENAVKDHLNNHRNFFDDPYIFNR